MRDCLKFGIIVGSKQLMLESSGSDGNFMFLTQVTQAVMGANKATIPGDE